MAARTSPEVVRGGRRAELLQIAARLFADGGYAGTSMGDIGAAAGISGPALYWHFSSKEALLSELLADVSENLLSGAKACRAAAADREDALTRLVDAHLTFAVGDPAMITLHERELGHLPPDTQHRIRRAQRLYIEEWVAALRQVHPTSREEHCRAVVQGTFGLLNATPRLTWMSAPELTHVLRQAALATLGSVPA